MKLFFLYFLMELKSAMEYKLSFLLVALGQFIVSFSAFLMLNEISSSALIVIVS